MSKPYTELSDHIVDVKALYCEDGCGAVETSGYGDDTEAGKELAKQGWRVVEHSMGGLTPICPSCAKRRDAEAGE